MLLENKQNSYQSAQHNKYISLPTKFTIWNLSVHKARKQTFQSIHDSNTDCTTVRFQSWNNMHLLCNQQLLILFHD